MGSFVSFYRCGLTLVLSVLPKLLWPRDFGPRPEYRLLCNDSPIVSPSGRLCELVHAQGTRLRALAFGLWSAINPWPDWLVDWLPDVGPHFTAGTEPPCRVWIQLAAGEQAAVDSGALASAGWGCSPFSGNPIWRALWWNANGTVRPTRQQSYQPSLARRAVFG